MGQAFCSPQGPSQLVSAYKVKESMKIVKKAARPRDSLAPAVTEWYEELYEVLRQVEKRCEATAGPEQLKEARLCKVVVATTKGINYWVKEINEQLQMGTDGKHIASASGNRLQRAIAPQLEIMKEHRNDFIESPFVALTYYLVSMRNQFSEYMRWVDPDLKMFDDEICKEISSLESRTDSPWKKAAESAASKPTNGGFRDTSAPLRIYSDGINVAEICPKLYSSKLAERTY